LAVVFEYWRWLNANSTDRAKTLDLASVDLDYPLLARNRRNFFQKTALYPLRCMRFSRFVNRWQIRKKVRVFLKLPTIFNA
jgi:hypothetical protein